MSITNHSAIVTDGSTAHGIAAQSRAGGYSDATIAFLQSMRSPAGVAPFTVTAETDKTFYDVSVGFDLIDIKGIDLRLSGFGDFSSHTTTLGASLKLSVPF